MSFSSKRREVTCLTIAGSDSGGGAGIQADLKTFAAHDCYGASVITALTAQNTLGVQDVHHVNASFVTAQYESVTSDFSVDCIKIGMLATAEIIDALADLFRRDAQRLPPVVLDPVCVSTSGHRLLAEDAIDSLRTKLLPLCQIVTPNLSEAELLSGHKIASIEDMQQAAKLISAYGVPWVMVKGGHLPQGEGDERYVVDLLYNGTKDSSISARRPFLDSKNTHGTGCTLSSAIAANIARGETISSAVRKAADYVADAIFFASPIGQGSGPVAHFHALVPRTIPRCSPANPHPFTNILIEYDSATWNRYVFHPFPIALAQGTASKDSFLEFIRQDYHFLKQYGRTHSLAAYKTEDMREMSASMEIVAAVCRETEMHVGYCAKYGISREELMATPESIEGTAYSRYVLDTSMRGDLLDGRVVTAACLIGYGHVGKRLCDPSTSGKVDRSDANPYWAWVAEYGADWYQQAVQTGIDLLEKTVHESPISPRRLKELCEIFKKATELEIAFWDAAVAAGNSNETIQQNGHSLQ